VQSRIMVVDSSVVSREVLTRVLCEVIDGAEVCAFASGKEALDHLEKEHYDLVTTSLMLSDMDGLDLCRQLRDSSAHHFTPLIVISGDADQRLLREGFAAGVTDYFDKSRGYPAFGKFIKTFMQRHRGMVGRALYVEDSRTAAAMTKRILEHHGLQVTHVTSAEEAMEILKPSVNDGVPQLNGDYDIVITDFHLRSEISGGDLLHAIRARYHYSSQELPVLMITGSEDTRTQVEAFHSGANDFVNKPLIEEVLMARIHSLLLIKQQYDALELQNRKMEELATTDNLTGVRNRHFLLAQGESIHSAESNQPFWVMIIDIDHFKKINDNQGHLTGDRVLAALGTMLKLMLQDAAVIRFGGEEFAVLLPHHERKAAMERTEAVRQGAERLHPDKVSFTVSVGLAGSMDHPGADLNALIGLADRALYASKAAGRNRACITLADGEALPLDDAQSL
jgi:two-component system, cell cycle response regulator